MFNNIISWSLRHKVMVLACAVVVATAGAWSVSTMKVDILPDINKPTVTVFAESDGMAAEEVERLILYPLESAVLGAPDVDRVRGSASFAQAVLIIEFDWGTDILRNRQITQERLSQAILPEGVKVALGPSTSLLGEISWVGVSSPNSLVSPMELRTFADFVIKPALLKVPGVASVLVMGGDVREWQIQLNAERMRRYRIMPDDVRRAVEGALTNKSGSLLTENNKEYPIRIIVAPEDVSDLEEISLGRNSVTGRSVRVGDIATLVEGRSIIRGSGAIDGKPGVVLRVIRQPDAETLQVTKKIDEMLTQLSPGLPEDVVVHSNLFRQEGFIRAGLGNVEDALRDGTILIIAVLIVFLMNIRMTLITLVAIPLSILTTAIVFKLFGLSVNVMTLGGVAVAIGELVDDSIVDVENIFRRLRRWFNGGKKDDRESVVLSASNEVRNSIVYATILVAVVFIPIFFMPGIEGRLLAALGTAYLVSLVASMIVSLSVTPVLASLLLDGESLRGHERETAIVRVIKERITPWVYWCIHNVRTLSVVVTVAVGVTLGMYFFAGKEGIPPFNEGSMVVMFYLPPGTALSTTNQYAVTLEKALLKVEGIRQVSNIAGRSQADPHGGSSNSSEMQIALKPGYEKERDRIMQDIQKVLDGFTGADFSLGQPITHRVEMLLSGVRAPIVVKVYGDSPVDMDQAAKQVLAELEKQEGIENPRVQQNTIIPELRIYVDRNRIAEYGISSGEVARDLEMGLMGDRIGQVRLGAASVDVVARFDVESKGTMASLNDLALPYAEAGSLGSVGNVRVEGGRASFDHEGGRRVLVVSANYQGSDIVGAVEKAKESLERQKLPTGVALSFEGNYKSQKESSRRLLLISIAGIAMIFAVLYHAFKSASIALIVMANIPTVLIGGMIGIWVTGGSINVAHMVGFVSLAGIVSRNGIMLIGRSLALVQDEGFSLTPETVVRATLDRVVPVLMTSAVTTLALIPLLISGSDPGKEMLHPLAVVMFGGLISSAAISLFLTPAWFYRFGASLRSQSRSTVSSGF